MSNDSCVKLLIMSILYYIIIAAIIVYACMNAYLYYFQRSILYLPVKEMAGPKNYGLYKMDAVTLQTSDDLDITAWYAPPSHNEPVMLYFHGNAGNLGDRSEKLHFFLEKGFGVLAVSWRGYGNSEGSPSETGLYNDARAALKWLAEKGYKPNDIFIYGESLGSGVAVQMATEFKAKAIILEAPYTSISDRAAQLYPYIPVKLLLKDHFDSISKIKNVEVPVMIFHGYRDTVMPISHSRKILAAANNPKEARFFDNVGHTDFNLAEIASITHEFVHRIK